VHDVKPGRVQRRVRRPEQERAQDEQWQRDRDGHGRDGWCQHQGQRQQAHRRHQDPGADVAAAQQPVGDPAAGEHPGRCGLAGSSASPAACPGSPGSTSRSSLISS
jgi:hypothetical protein